MIPLPLLRKIRLSTFSNIADTVTVIATVAVISMDLGLPYTSSETAFYTHPIIQSIIVFCVAYEMLENLSLSTIILGVWLLIKYFNFLKTAIKTKIEENKQDL
tara:strand:+ start:566 stop:874 length:309 start_codon:yes stop_codon:yes gene_type:complete